MILLPHSVNPFQLSPAVLVVTPRSCQMKAIIRIAELSETHCQLHQALHQERLDENNG